VTDEENGRSPAGENCGEISFHRQAPLKSASKPFLDRNGRRRNADVQGAPAGYREPSGSNAILQRGGLALFSDVAPQFNRKVGVVRFDYVAIQDRG
jgi:hypothetical protein